MTDYDKDFKTDPHQRPQITNVSWEPSAPFAGDSVKFTPTVSVVDPAQDLLVSRSAQTPVDSSNKDSLASVFRWDISGFSNPKYDFSPADIFERSGEFNLMLTVADQRNDCGQNGDEACECRYQTAMPGTGVVVSKPKPYFREVKP